MPFGKAGLPYLLVAPSLLLAAFIVLWPVGELIRISLHETNRFGQLRDFAGLSNFAAMAADADFKATIVRTLIWTGGVLSGTLFLSLPVALILRDDFYGCSLARVIVMLPWAMSLSMTSIVWRWALNGESGMLNSGLLHLGLIDHNVQWLARSDTAFPIEILIGILVSMPFTVTTLLGGLSSIPGELYDAAATEGAGRWQQFRHITLPLLMPFIHIAIVLNTIYVFNSFPIIWVMTQGGPANSTDTAVTYLYKLAFRFGKLGEAAAVSVTMFSVLICFTYIYFRLMRRSGEDI